LLSGQRPGWFGLGPLSNRFASLITKRRLQDMSVTRQVCLIIIVLITFDPGAFAQSARVEKHLAQKRIDGLTKEANSVSFLVVGDWGRNGQGDQQNVSDWMGIAASQINAKFVISTGDNFYCCGVASADDYQWISSFENVYRSHSLQIPWYVALGNHDYQGSVQAQIDYARKRQRWKLPDRYYTMAIEGVRFVFIDTTPFIKSYYRSSQYPDLHQQDTTRQLQWLDSVLSVSSEKWRFVIGHHPVLSIGQHGTENDMVLLLKPRLEKYNVPVYFAGHDHSLQSLKEHERDVHYVISGGGAERTPVTPNTTIMRFGLSSTGFLVVATSASRTKITFVSDAGKVLHEEVVAMHSDSTDNGR
jgi:tartrate-resistant acid phosphatase type 5